MGKLFRSTGIGPAVARSVASSARSGRDKVRTSLAPAVAFEKRILNDAVLDWDLGGLDQTTTLLTGIHTLLSAQLDGYSDFLESFDTLADTALTTLATFEQINDAGAPANQQHLDDLIDRMRSAVTELKSGSLTALNALFVGDNQDYDADLTTRIEDSLIGLLTSDVAANTTALRDAIGEADIAATFNLAAFTAEDEADRVPAMIDALVAGLDATLVAAGITAEDATEAVTLAADTFFNALLGDGLSLSLEDIVVDGQTLVSFTQGADTGAVIVAVHLPDFAFDLDALLDLGLDGTASPVTLQTDPDAGSITFTVSSLVETTGALVNAIGAHITDFDFAPLFTFGGAVNIDGLDSSFNLGLLTAEVAAVTTAQIRATVRVADTLDLGGKLNLTGTPGLQSFATDPELEVVVEVDALEADGQADTGFAELAEDESYALLQIDLGGALTFFSADDEDAARTYAAAITVATVLDNSASVTPAEIVANFLRDARIGFDVDLSGSVADETLRDTLEQTVEALAGMGIDQITGFLSSIGDLIADVIDSVTFEVEIPFTDIEIASVMETINSAFTGLSDLFLIAPEDLGYSQEALTSSTISPSVDMQTGEEIDAAALSETLGAYAGLTFAIVETDPATDALTKTVVEVDLASDAVWSDPDATDDQRLDALVALLADALGDDGFDITLVAGAMQIAVDVANFPGRTLVLMGATRKEEAVDPDAPPVDAPPAPVFDDNVDLSVFGFGNDALLELPGLTEDPDATEQVLRIAPSATGSFVPGANFDEAMVGVEALRYFAEIDGETIEIRVETPVDADGEPLGWYDELTGAANVEAMVDAFNLAFADAEVPLEASLNEAGDGIDFAATADATGDILFGIDPEKMTRAFDLSTLVEWVNTRLNGELLMEGSELKLTEEGKLMFVFPTMEALLELGEDSGLAFDAADLGVDMLADLSLSARLTAALNARFDAAVGIDLLGFASDLIGDSGDSVIEARDKAEAAEDDDAGPTLGDLVLDNVFFADLALSIDIEAQATAITGAADIGLMAVVIGRDDPALNFLTLNAQLDVSLVGQRGGEDFGSEVSLRNLFDAVTYKDADGNYDSLRGLNGLIGRSDFQGGIVTDGAGNALDADGEAVTAAASLRQVDADTYELQDGEVLSMLHLNLGDLAIDSLGVQGLNEGFIDGASIVIGNLANPLETLGYQLLGDGADSVEALANLGQGDILDSFSTIANMLSVLGASLKEKLPFLDEDIPLLNFSLLDAVDFSKDFADALKELRANPDTGLAKADTFLEEYFGPDTITLGWDSDAKTLTFKLSLEFLKDYSEEIAFNFDLAAILGDALGEALGGAGEIAAELITGFVDAGGDGKLVFDPDLTLDLAFGIDLSATLVDPTVLADEDTALDALSTVGTLTQADRGANDLMIRWQDRTDATNKTVRVDIDGAATLGEIVEKIDTAVTTAFGDTVSFSFDAETGQITLADSNADLTDVADVNALFGTTLAGREFAHSEPASEPAEDDPATAEDESAAYIPHIFALSEDFDGFATAYAFTLGFGPAEGGAFPETVLVELDADPARLDADAFAEALNAAFAALDMPRSAINANSVAGWTVAVSSLLTASVQDGVITLTTTNFTDAIGADPIAFGVAGSDISHDVVFTLTEIAGSNALRALGFEDIATPLSGDVVSQVLHASQDIGAPRVYLDTEASGIMLTMVAGAPDGLNIKLGLGPIAINVVDGAAQLTAGAGLTDPAFLGISFVDIDGDDHAGQYDLSDLFAIATDDDRSFADLLALDIGIAINVELPFSDSLGILDPVQHGLTYTTDLVTTDGPVAFSDIDPDDLGAAFNGDLVNIFNGDDLEGDFELNLPDLTEMLSNFNILALLNNPRAVLDGLDMILDQMQSLFDEYLSGIDLPVVGDSIGAAVTFFNDFRFNIIEKARVVAETPMENGELPTTVDLITGWFNDQLNDLFNPDGDHIQFIQMFLNTDGGMTDSYLYGSINFTAEIFREKLDIALDLGIPGFELEVKDGSEVELALGYSVNIGFGMDKTGFFLLNDTDEDEIAIDFIADAGSLQGSAKLLGLLGLKADGITIGADGGISGQGSAEGTVEVRASLGVKLYGDDGALIVDADAAEDEVAMDLSGIDLKNGLNETLEFEKLVYLSKIDTDQLVAFTFNASVDVQIGLEANILDPTTGEPIVIAGAQVIPSVMTEIVFKGIYDSTESDLGFQIVNLEFQDVRMDMSVLYEAIIAPVVDPIMAFIEPILPLIEWMNEEPFKYLVDIIGKAFPIFGMVATVAQTIEQIADFVAELDASGGMFNFGSFDFTDAVADGGKLDGDTAQRDTSGATVGQGSGGNPFGVFGNTESGFSIELPLLTDPMSALNILTGKFDEVDLIEVTFTLMNLDFKRTSIADMVLDELGAPGWVKDIIDGVLKAELEARLIAKMTAGYDLGGIVNFINTLDPVRLLDGVYLDSNEKLLDVFFGIWIELNAGIAGMSGSAHGGVSLEFNDPNADGKLRIPELIAIFEASDPETLLGNLFKGNVSAGAKLSFWAGIETPIIDLTWDVELFDVEFSEDFGGFDIGTQISQKVEEGETAILNIGARAGGNMTSFDQDGDDRVVIDGPNSPIRVDLSNPTSGSLTGSFNQAAGGLIIPAGEGDNTIDMSKLTFGKPTITYAGSGKDTIILPNMGLNVVFAGDGVDTITQTGASTATYVIFGGGGADKVNIQNGNVIYFGDSDFGMRDKFMTEFANGGLTEAKIRTMLGLAADGTVGSGGSYTAASGATFTLAQLLNQYTALTQLSAANTVETVTLGGGNHVILTGRAADEVTVTGGLGAVRVYSGDGADVLHLGGATLYAEAGAGSDRVFTSAGQAEVWGWGKQAGEDGTLGTSEGQAIDALAQRDGADLMLGGTGGDKFFGQIGKDVIEGGFGADTIAGGLGVDLVTGGTFNLSTAAGAPILLANYNPANGFGTGITVSVGDAADGGDSLSGGLGADILLGGGGNDTVNGGDNADVIIGDFARIGLSANLVAETIQTEWDTSSNSGTDVLSGGQGNDILIAGGSVPGTSESITDLEGSNVVLGDFGRVSGPRLSEAVTLVETFTSPRGGADVITLGRGNDMVMGGEGDDTINAGRGGDIVVADLGRIDITARTVTGQGAAAGNDRISFDGSGPDITDIVIAGLGDDSITAGRGGLLLLGDDGTITVDPVALSALRNYAPLGSSYPNAASLAQAQADDAEALAKIARLAKEMVSANGATDGNDTVTITGAGFLRAVMGGGNDNVTLGTAESYVLADDGTLTVLSNGVELVAAVSQKAGADTVTSDSASDLIIAGAGNDSITLGSGEDVVLADMGQIAKTTTESVATIVATADSALAGNDTVQGAAGKKTVLLGQGDDSATLGNDGSLVIGDTGQSTRVANDWRAETGQAIGGNDSITSGSGDDTLLAGFGSDSIDAGHGDNIILADAGTWAAKVLTSVRGAADGNDSVTAGTGQDRAILGGGHDTADLSSGNNRAIGDSGVIDWATAERVEVTEILIGGSDTLLAAGGNDVLFGGAGNDSLSAGNGDNLILGDAGSFTPSVLTSAANAADGNDSVTAGTGQDRAILGGGHDTADLSAGNNRVIGDSGVIGWAIGEQVEVSDAAIGGNDTITTTSGDDIAFGAQGSDRIDAGNGTNLVFGDTGLAGIDSAGRASQTALDTVNGGNDTLTTGTGRDALIGGVGGDNISSGAGDDAVLGDLGRFTEAQGASDGSLLSPTTNPITGNDSISSGDGDDIVIAGLGNDTVMGGIGEDMLTGDDAHITFAATADIATLVAVNITLGGNDVIQTDGAKGDDIIIGQAGNDSITAAGGDDLILADLARVTLGAPRLALASQSAADRLQYAEGINPELGFNDTVLGGAGADLILAGFGSDSISGQSEQDFIIGDSAIIQRNWKTGALGAISESITIDTNFAYLDGGFDNLRGGLGADVMIGGLGPDLFFGDTAEDALFSDGYAGLFKSVLPAGFATDPSPHRALYTSNFAGPGAVDVVSEAQQNTSIGNSLDLVAASGSPDNDDRVEADITAQLPQATADSQLSAIFDLLGTQDVLRAVAELLAAGADTALITRSLQNYLKSSGLLAQGLDPVTLELILDLIVAQMVKTAQGDAMNEAAGMFRLAAE